MFDGDPVSDEGRSASGSPRLTEAQRAAVEHRGRNLLIIAGAGTGKTTTLAGRLASIVEAGTPPERIVLLTFSRRAATELAARAEASAGADRLRGMWAGTFHAVGSRVLRHFGGSAGIPADSTLLDPGDAADLLAMLRDRAVERRLVERGVDAPPVDSTEGRSRKARKEVLAGALSRVVNTRTPLDQVVRHHYPWVVDQLDEFRAVYRDYVAHKRDAHLFDYDDLLTLWHALALDPTVGAVIASRFDHVLVDEYQDTNVIQAEILGAMAGHGVAVSAVGDDAQAIYGFRGGTVRNILDFPTAFDAEVVALEHNHRSSPEIVEVANRTWAQAAERHDKQLVSTRPSGPRPRIVTSPDEHREARSVVDAVLAALEAGTPLRDQAVLFRTAHHADLLEVELAVRKVPYVKFGGLSFLESAHVKDLLATVRMALNPRDALAWFRILQRIDGIGPTRARRLAELVVDADGDLRTATDAAALPGDLCDALHRLGDALAEARRAGTPGEALDRLLVWLGPHLDRFGNGDVRRADLERLSDLASGSGDLQRFLTELTLDPPASTGDLAGPPVLDDDYLTLSTIHSAKGGEWTEVHLLHLADGAVPSDLSTGDPEQLAEELRLLYVGITRARRGLHLHVPLRFHHHRNRFDDPHTIAPRSRFLSAEVADACKEVADLGGTLVDTASGEILHDVGRSAAARADADLAALLG